MVRRSFLPAALALTIAATARGGSAEAAPPPVQTPPAPQAAAGPSGHLAFDAQSLNLGDVIRGQDAVATFTYRNTGDVPLHILSVKPG